MSNICSKANRKLSVLTRVAKVLPFKKIQFFSVSIVKAFIESWFKYCPLLWIFHGRQTNDKINKLHERALRIVYSDTLTSFEELLVKDKTFTIHHRNIQPLSIEIYIAMNNLPGGNLTEFFVRNNHNDNLGSKSN